MKIAFDVDDTLIKHDKGTLQSHPNYDLIQVLRWFHRNGDRIFVWSAGGIDYAQMWVNKLGLTDFVKVIPKNNYDGKTKIDVAFDDVDTNLATVDIKVR